MIQLPQFRNEITRRKRLLLAAACLATFTASSTGAVAGSPQCGCSDDCCETCERGHGPIYKTLDTVAGGIEKLLFLGLKRRGNCDDMMCGDGCDALPMGDMMMMSEPSSMPMDMASPMMMQPMHSQPMHSQPMHSQPMHSQPMHQHAEPSLPPTTPPNRLMQTSPMQRSGPSAPMRMSEPRMSPMPTAPMQIPRPAPLRENGGGPTGSGILPPIHDDNGSMFDSPQDPFRDDSAQLNAPRTNGSASGVTRTASYRGSSRRANAAR